MDFYFLRGDVISAGGVISARGVISSQRRQEIIFTFSGESENAAGWRGCVGGVFDAA